MREVLEGAFAPNVAAEIMADAHQEGVVLDSVRDVLTFCRGPLAERIVKRGGISVKEAILQRLEQVLVATDAPTVPPDSVPPPDISIEISIGDDGREDTRVMPTVHKGPVSVLVIAGSADFAELLLASLGRTKVAPTTVHTENEIRKAMFSAAPLLVVIDATAAPGLDRGTIAAALRGLPDNVVSIVWGAETEFGDGLAAALEAAGVPGATSLRYGEGLAPLVDLIMARQQ